MVACILALLIAAQHLPKRDTNSRRQHHVAQHGLRARELLRGDTAHLSSAASKWQSLMSGATGLYWSQTTSQTGALSTEASAQDLVTVAAMDQSVVSYHFGMRQQRQRQLGINKGCSPVLAALRSRRNWSTRITLCQSRLRAALHQLTPKDALVCWPASTRCPPHRSTQTG